MTQESNQYKRLDTGSPPNVHLKEGAVVGFQTGVSRCMSSLNAISANAFFHDPCVRSVSAGMMKGDDAEA